jgi:hypothetical protein
MHNQIRLLSLTLVMTGFTFGLARSNAPSAQRSQDRNHTARCTRQALAALRSFPKLDYVCGEEPDDKLKTNPRRLDALRAYLTRLESATPAGWWAASVDDLNNCAVTHEARALTGDERRELESYREFSGDASTRFLILPDPCVKYSYITRNAFVLQRAGNRVCATQVVDAFYTRLDPGVEIELVRQNAETLVIVETDSEPTNTPELSDISILGIGENTLSVYAIDPATHRAVPRKLFMDRGKLTNVLLFEAVPA